MGYGERDTTESDKISPTIFVLPLANDSILLKFQFTFFFLRLHQDTDITGRSSHLRLDPIFDSDCILVIMV